MQRIMAFAGEAESGLREGYASGQQSGSFHQKAVE